MVKMTTYGQLALLAHSFVPGPLGESGELCSECQVRIRDTGLRMEEIAQRLRNNRLAASASRDSESRKSITAPAKSMARYR
jgi:hypothetical protein